MIVFYFAYRCPSVIFSACAIRIDALFLPFFASVLSLCIRLYCNSSAVFGEGIMASDSISVSRAALVESEGATHVEARHAVLLRSATLAAPVAFSIPLPSLPAPGKPWALPPTGLAVFYGRPETPRLFHYFLPRLLGEGKRVLCLDGANRFDPLLIARLARQRGIETAEFNRAIRVARAFTCFQLTELLVRVPRFIEKFAADALIVTALPDLYLDEDIRDRDAAVAFRHALDALQELAPLPLGVAVFSEGASFGAPRLSRVKTREQPCAAGPRHVGARHAVPLHVPHPSAPGPRHVMFTQLAAQATELWRFALDGENDKLRLISEKHCSPGLLSRVKTRDRIREFSAATSKIPRL
jgi:hypothetical protein